MRVSSPIGDLPFEPRRLRYRHRTVEIEGAMGAWPAQVVVTASDLPCLLRLVAAPLTAAVGITAAAIGAVVVARRTT